MTFIDFVATSCMSSRTSMSSSSSSSHNGLMTEIITVTMSLCKMDMIHMWDMLCMMPVLENCTNVLVTVSVKSLVSRSMQGHSQYFWFDISVSSIPLSSPFTFPATPSFPLPLAIPFPPLSSLFPTPNPARGLKSAVSSPSGVREGIPVVHLHLRLKPVASIEDQGKCEKEQ